MLLWNNVKLTMNSVYKNNLGRHLWSNSEFSDDAWLDVLVRNMPRFSWHERVLSKGVFTWYQDDFHPGASSLRLPLMALYSFTWYQHKMSCRRESYRRRVHPGSCAGARFSSRHENSFRCHVNRVWPFVSYPLKFHQFYGTIRLTPQQKRLYVNTVQLFISPRNESRTVNM